MDSICVGADFLGDIEVTRYSSKKKSEGVILSFEYDTSEVICKNVKTGKTDTNGMQRMVLKLIFLVMIFFLERR